MQQPDAAAFEGAEEDRIYFECGYQGVAGEDEISRLSICEGVGFCFEEHKPKTINPKNTVCFSWIPKPKQVSVSEDRLMSPRSPSPNPATPPKTVSTRLPLL